MPLFGKGPKGPIDFSAIDPPWDKARTSIYAHIKQHLSDEEPKLSEAGQTLPDEDLIYKEGGLRWVAGGLDGAFGHHFGAGDQEENARDLLKAFKAVLKSGDSKSLAKFYELLIKENTLNFIDPFIEQLANEELIDHPSLYALAKWILKTSPDREAVKAAIAILGVCATSDDCGIFIDIGKHEEFTLYSAVAIAHSAENPEEALWELGKAVDGWGRIHVVERLAPTENPEIQNWLMREGYKNSIMYEYTAQICADAGNLLQALSQDEVDDELIDAACCLLSSMNNPGPGIEDYEDAPQATQLLLQHLQKRDLTLAQLVSVSVIKEIVLHLDVEQPELQEWSPLRDSILSMCEAIRSRPDWREKVNAALMSDNDQEFWYAINAAQLLGVDTWDRHFERVKQGKHSDWHYLMQTADEDRVQRAVSLAEEIIPLSEIMTGAADELGLGPKFEAHSSLDWVVQELRHWPGHGYKLVMAGLQSPVVRNRNMSLAALQHWGKDHWQSDTADAIERLLKVEPNENTRQLAEDVLAGKPPGEFDDYEVEIDADDL